MKRCTLLATLCILAAVPRPLAAYETASTHAGLTDRAAQHEHVLHHHLRRVYGLPLGSYEPIRLDLDRVPYRARGRVTTVAMQEFQFLSPVRVGDLVDLFARLVRVGTSSMTVEVSAWARRESLPEEGHQVANGRLVYVAVDADGRSRPVDEAGADIL